MKKYASLITSFALLMTTIESNAQNIPAPPNSIPPAVANNISRPQHPRAYRSGVASGVNSAAIAAGVGIIVAIAAIAVISNNSHSH